MHKRTAHALVDSDDGTDAFLQDSLEPSSPNKNTKNIVEETVKEIVSDAENLDLLINNLY